MTEEITFELILKECVDFSQSGKNKNDVSGKENDIMRICLKLSACLTIRDESVAE